MKLHWQPRKWLEKKVKLGLRGYPVGTVAFYGPDNQRASKVAVGIVMAAGAEPVDMRKWIAESGDIRHDANVYAELVAYLRDNAVRSVAMVDGILGCPHEESVDYPEGQSCPHCLFWAGRNRFSGI